jgi:hypothetical protein
MKARTHCAVPNRRNFMSDERDKRGPSETDGDLEKRSGDVEAHKLAGRMSGEPEEKRETDEADVEGHMLGDKHSAGKMTGKHQP